MALTKTNWIGSVSVTLDENSAFVSAYRMKHKRISDDSDNVPTERAVVDPITLNQLKALVAAL